MGGGMMRGGGFGGGFGGFGGGFGGGMGMMMPGRGFGHIAKPGVNCHQCGGFGHMARDCPTEKKCYKCQGLGHIAKLCPNEEAGGRSMTCFRVSEFLGVVDVVF